MPLQELFTKIEKVSAKDLMFSLGAFKELQELRDEILEVERFLGAFGDDRTRVVDYYEKGRQIENNLEKIEAGLGKWIRKLERIITIEERLNQKDRQFFESFKKKINLCMSNLTKILAHNGELPKLINQEQINWKKVEEKITEAIGDKHKYGIKTLISLFSQLKLSVVRRLKIDRGVTISDDLDEVLLSLPGLKLGKGVWQNGFHEFDVYGHSLNYVKHVKKLTKDKNIIAAAYLHDIAKQFVAEPKLRGVLEQRAPGRMYHKFTYHESVGGDIVRRMNPEIFRKLDLVQDRIAFLVAYHGAPGDGIKAMRATTNYNNFLQKFRELEDTLDHLPVPKVDILTMFLADKLAQGRFCSDKKELFAVREALLNKRRNLRKLYNLQKRMYGNKE